MNFFIPLDGDQSLAESLRRRARELLHETGFPTEDRRIHSLYCSIGGEPRVVQVGADGDDGELVLMIFRAAGAPFYWVCTMASGLFEGSPIPVPASQVACVIPFDED